MPRILLSDIPNVPQLPGAPPVAEYGRVPGAKFAMQPYVRGHVEPMRTQANFEQYAKDLQQAPLPGGFAQGQEMIVSAAGKYASVAGQAESAWATSVSNALNNVGSIITDVANKANQDKDAVDVVRYQEMEQSAALAFENQMRQENVPVEQWGDRWQKEGAPRFLEAANNLGTTPMTRAKIQAKAAGYAESKSYGFQIESAKKIQADNLDTLNGSFSRGLDEGGNREIAQGANDTAYSLGYINSAKHTENNHKIEQTRQQDALNLGISKDPKDVREQAALVMEGKKASKEYEFLNGNPELAKKTFNNAEQEWNRRRGEARQSLLNDIHDGGKPLSPDEIERRGREAGMDENDIDAFKNSAKTQIPFDPKATADATRAVAAYANEAKSDTDMSRYNALHNQIITSTSPEVQQQLTAELNGHWKNRNDPVQAGDFQKKELQETYQLIDKYHKSGLLVGRDKEGKEVKLPSGLGTKEGEREKIVDEKAFQAAEQRRMELYYDAQAYIKDHPDFKAGELSKYINGRMAPDAQQKADDAPASQMPTPPRATFYRATPKVPAAMEWRYGPQTIAGPAPEPIFPKTGPPSLGELQGRLEGRMAPRGPRTLKETPQFSAAWNKFARSDQPQQEVTAYVPGMGGIEGGPGVAARAGKAFTMEDYETGTAPYVSVAMDSKSDWQGKYLISPSYPGVVFKVEDTGDAFKGKAESAVDIAFKDPSKATSYKETATFAPVDEQTALEMSSAGAPPKVGATSPAGGEIVASVSNVVNPGARTQMMEGTMNVAGTQYAYRSGGGGRGSLPPGTYVVTEHRPSRDTPGMTVGDVGFSFALSDKYDRRVGGTRTLLRIHPDGGTAGTAGCIGIVGGKEVQAQFRDDLTAEIRRAGGKLRLTVG
jgi:hypothetical protein